jgi:hypothetical protein
MTKRLISVLLTTAAAAGFLRSRGKFSTKHQKKTNRNLIERALSRHAADDAARRYLMYLIMPVWAVTGFLDWLWHKQTKIETTSGTKESLLHLIMMAEVGAPILTGLFLEMNAGSLALMAAGWLMHEATVALDVTYTQSRRKILAREQHTHSYMQSIPFEIVALMACLYPEQFLSLFGGSPEKPDFKLRFRKPPIPMTNFALIVGGMGLVATAPHIEELWRCVRVQRKGLAGSEIPECARVLYAGN